MSRIFFTFLFFFGVTVLVAQEHPKLQKAYDHHNAGELDQAFALYSEIIAESPKEIDAYFNRAFIFYGRKEYPNTISDMKKVLEAYPKNALATAVVGHCYLEALNFSEARKYCQKAYDLDPTKMPYSINLAYSLLFTGELQLARAQSEKTVKLFSSQDEFNNFLKDNEEFIANSLKDAHHKELASKEIQYIKNEFSKIGTAVVEINSNSQQAQNLEINEVKPGEAAPFYEKAFLRALQSDLLDMAEPNFDNAVYTYKYVGNYNKAVEISLTFFNYSKSKALHNQLRKSAHHLGNCYKQLKELDKSARYFEEAVAAGRTLNNLRYLEFDLNELGQTYDFMGEVEKSIKAYNESITAKKQLNAKDNLPVTLNNLASVYSKSGQFEKAIVAYDEAISLANQGYSKKDMGIFKNGLGRTYQALGNFDKAMQLFKESLEVERSNNNDAKVAERMNSIGALYDAMGQLSEATSWFNQSLELAKKVNASLTAAVAYNNLGAIHSSLKEYDKAMESYKKAATIYRTEKSELEAVLAEVNMSKILIGKGDTYQAGKYLTNAEPIIRKENNKHYLIELLKMKGAYHLRLEQWTESAKYYQEAVNITEEIRKNAKGEERKTYFANMLFSYQVLATVHIHSNLPGSAIKAFNVTELSRSKVLAERLSGNENITPPSVETIQDKLGANTALINMFNADLNPIMHVVVTNDRTGGFTTWTDNFNKAINADYRSEVDFVLKNQRGMKIQKTVVNDATAQKKSEMENVINYYRALLMSTGSSDHQGTKVSNTTAGREENISKAKAMGRLLYDLLIHPIEEMLVGKTELVIVTDGILGYLPFETLIAPDGKYLVEKYHITYAQSATVLDLIQKRSYSPDRKPLLAFGGGVYDQITYSKEMVGTEHELKGVEKTASNKIASRGSLRDSYAALGVGSWSNLPGTLNEVQNIAKVIPGSQIITGAQVSENKIKSLSGSGELANYKVLHFATHGLVVPSIPELSALVLSQFKTEQDNEDGYLRMGEIENLKLKADYVNLSACETGLGKIYGGEGVVGLTQSFLLAGANGLSVSLWQVADESTSQLMTGMYQLVQDQKLSHARALTEMKRKFIRGEYGDVNKNPYFWAPFVYYGK